MTVIEKYLSSAPALGVARSAAIKLGMRDDDLIDDCVQNALLRAWRRRGTYKEDLSQAGAWVYSVARDTGLNMLRDAAAQKRTPPGDMVSMETAERTAVDGAAAADVRLDGERRRQILRSVLAQVATQDVALLFASLDLSLQSESGMLGMSYNTARSRVERTRIAVIGNVRRLAA